MPHIPPSQASALLASFTSFLTIALHSLLFHRNLYPSSSFLTARAYNLPVHQSRHPLVCAWIRDAVAALHVQLRLGVVRRICLVAHAPDGKRDVLERWVFDVQRFPSLGEGEPAEDPAEPAEGDEGEGSEEEADVDAEVDVEDDRARVNWTDVDEALRGALVRIAHAAQGDPLPDGCTFSLAVELRDEAEAPIGHPQPWIPSHPKEALSTTPIRSVRADPLFFECWVEKGSRPDVNTQITASP